MKRFLLILMLALLPLSSFADTAEESFDMKAYLFGHISDSYWWHITSWKGKEIEIPLPVIVCSREKGFSVFSSSRLENGRKYEGYYIAGPDSKYKDKIVFKDRRGRETKPFDISITKNVLALMISAALLLWLILACSRWYRRHDVLSEAPKGIAALLEPVIMMIDDEVIKDSIGEGYEKYSPYLLTAFFFILINNLLGIIPFFPGGANVTGNIAVTLSLALFTFLAVNLFGSKEYYKEIFWPDVPMFLKAIPIMPVIEFIGMFTKPFSLMVRLFANILAGHILLLSVIAMIFITAKMGPVLNGSLSVVAVLFGVFMDCLELLVAFIQAYVFTMLSSVFIGMAHPKEK